MSVTTETVMTATSAFLEGIGAEGTLSTYLLVYSCDTVLDDGRFANCVGISPSSELMPPYIMYGLIDEIGGSDPLGTGGDDSVARAIQGSLSQAVGRSAALRDFALVAVVEQMHPDGRVTEDVFVIEDGEGLPEFRRRGLATVGAQAVYEGCEYDDDDEDDDDD